MTESAFKEYIEKEIYKAFERLVSRDRVTISEFLKYLKFEVSCGNKVIKFSHTAMIKALLFMKLKGIRSQSKLAKYLKSQKQDALNLGFCIDDNNEILVPDQRTISHFLNHILDEEFRGILDSTVKLADELSQKFGIVFDIEPIRIKKPVIETSGKTLYNRKKDKLEEICRFAKKNVYPSIQMTMRHNTKYKKNKLLDSLVYLGREQAFAHDGLRRLETESKQTIPDSDTVLYRLKKYDDSATLQKTFEKAFDVVWKIAKNSNIFNKREYDVAIDSTEWFYYGKDAPMIVGKKPERGATKCYKFLTINIVDAGNRFTLLALPMGVFDSKTEIVDKLIVYTKNKIRIHRIYADRGFFSADIINLFKSHGLTFLMPATQNKRVAKMVNVLSAPSVVKDYEMTEGKAKFNLVVIDDGDGKKSFATNIDVDENEGGLATYLFNLYSKRWGIETSYRMKKELRARTTSKNYKIRLFYFLFATLLYNLWILIDAIISKSLLGRVIMKHLVTEKMFATVLFMMLGADYG